MSTYFIVLWALLFAVGVIGCWIVTFAGLPGNWLIVGLAAIYAWLMPDDSVAAIGWPLVGVLAGLATLGELLELVAGAFGVSKAGGSRRSAVLALLGSLLGGVAGLFGGAVIPIPVIGSLIGAVLFASLGALGGAMLGETWKGRGFDTSFSVGQAAFWGRMLGTLAKAMVGAVMVALSLVALVV